MSDNHEFQPGKAADGFDRREAKSGLVLLVAVMTTITLVAFIGAMYWLTYYTEGRESEAALKQAWRQTTELREREARELNTYGWLDKQKGIVRVPVARAMEILADEYQQGKVGYNTKAYAVKVEPPGGGAAPPAAPGSPETAPAAPPAAPAAPAAATPAARAAATPTARAAATPTALAAATPAARVAATPAATAGAPKH